MEQIPLSPSSRRDDSVRDILVVDVETSGLDATGCSLLEIGAVSLADRAVEFHVTCRAWEGAFISPEALRVNGRTPDDVHSPDYVSEHAALDLFLGWLRDHFGSRPRLLLAGMNPRFDLDFLRAARVRSHGSSADIDFIFGHRTLDLHSLAVREMLRFGSDDILRLHTDAIYELLEMEPEPQPHRAIEGARREARAFRRLLLD